ncbi:membrane-bound lytic murein transglycosylase MltC [Sansalvadorimonas verongulae]|uniref:membrane-bound lytic murein transglycosylase MltC n=1 Tax=Sansalvadorimonas verongulae TaxID=2172824 RepID=UPI0012BBC39A|nr:membrane-bound lytic murein transglycosylase MltC [Sansalvadorimonas verongulae]MTI12353.1 membrane-bound lytic murein transglycosylase MltC [Sansalvadorimonas verongulae]
MGRFLVLFPLFLWIAGCSTPPAPLVYDRTATPSRSVSHTKSYIQPQPESLDELGFEALIHMLAQRVEVNWGDTKSSGTKEYVKYSNDYRTRVMVNFDKRKVRVETLDRKDLRRAIVVTLLTPDDPEQVDLFSASDIVLGKEPVLYKQVLDNYGNPIRWEWRAGNYADYLMQHNLSRKSTSKGTVYAVDFDMVHQQQSAGHYQYASLVRKYSQKYRVDESLIYGIIRTESSFNPFAVSWANAYGLMQVVPRTAGHDVFQRLKKRRDKPTRNYLFQPANNIDVGTGYLHILDTVYLKGITNPLSRRYAIISAYNGGAGNVLRTFDKNRTRAVDKINRLEPSQVYWALTRRHPRQESRRYLEKVTAAEKDFHQGRI